MEDFKKRFGGVSEVEKGILSIGIVGFIMYVREDDIISWAAETAKLLNLDDYT